jgi:hypothetical protein
MSKVDKLKTAEAVFNFYLLSFYLIPKLYQRRYFNCKRQ